MFFDKIFLKYITTSFLFALATLSAFSQTLTGEVFELKNKKDKSAVAGVNVYWVGANTSSVTDSKGKFQLSKNGIHDLRLVVMFIGYKSDTIEIKKEQTIFDCRDKKYPSLSNSIKLSSDGSFSSTLGLSLLRRNS